MENSSRHPSLVTVRRGGRLTELNHRLLVKWAASCAKRVLTIFKLERPGDSRPADAISTAMAWCQGNATTGEARTAAVAAHAAARECEGAARLAARACGQAAATAHMADHELGAAYYALLAMQSLDPNRVDAELAWQLKALPKPVNEIVRGDMIRRANKFRGVFDSVSPDLGNANQPKK